MPTDENQMVRRAIEKKERRARRKLAKQRRTETPVDEPDLSLIREGIRESRRWSGGYGAAAFKHSDVFCVAGRTDFLRTVDRAALDATIAAGVGIKHPHPPRIEISFTIVRRARLYGVTNTDHLEDVVQWNANAAVPDLVGRKFSEWNTADVYLIRATAAFLIRAGRPLGSHYVVDLNWVISVGDPYQRGEARLLLAQSHLEAAMPDSKTRRGVLTRAGAHVTHLFGGIDRSRRRTAATNILEEILQDETYGCVTLPRSRVRLAQSWLRLGDHAKALRALDPRLSSPDWPEDHDHDINGTDSTLSVEVVSDLVQEGASSAIKSARRKCYKRALDIADSLSPSAIGLADALRLARLFHEISMTHPDSSGSWRASHLLFHLCPDPTKQSVSSELAMILHEHFMAKYLMSYNINYIANAYSYIDAAFKKLSDGAPEKIVIGAEWLTTSYIYSGATSLQTSVLPVLDYMDKFLRPDDARRIDYLTKLGMALSRSHERDDHIDRLVQYWEEHLNLVKAGARIGEETPQQLAEALENTAISLRLRSRENANDPMDLARSLDLSRQAFNLVGYSHDRIPLVYAFMLNEWSKVDGSPDDRREAVRIQTEALREIKMEQSWRPAKAVPQSERRIGDIPHLLEMTFLVARTESAECSDALMWLHDACLNDDYADLTTSLSRAATLCQFALASGDWDYPSKVASRALSRIERTLATVENPYLALYYIQGMSSMGAVALTSRGSPAKAAEMLERGATLRARIQLERSSTRKSSIITEEIPEQITPATIQRFENSHQIQGLASTLDGPIVYLAATAQTGLALVVTSQSFRSVWLPELTTASVDEWLDLTAEGKGVREASRGVPVRGARGEDSPGRAAVDEVIAAATAVLAPLESVLSSSGGHRPAHVIPIGQTAGIPWTYVLTQPVTINPSATLLNRSRTRPGSDGPRISITAPNPCHYGAESLSLLENAREEGAWLEDNVNFDNSATGSAATRSAFNKALNVGPEVLHIAAHGYVDTNSWGDVAHLLWTDNPSTRTAETTALPELEDLIISNLGTVFLAACWGGAPNRTLPDESISFPTAFLTAGAKSVIAPLWPIDDDVAYEFVMAFYEFWKLDGVAPTTALKRAAAEVRDAHPDSSTWAAFMLTGHI